MTKSAWLWIAAAVCAVLLAFVATVGVFLVVGSGGTASRYDGGVVGANPVTPVDCQLPPAVGTLVTYTAYDMGAMGGPMMGGAMGPMTFIPRQASAPAGDVTVELRNLGSRPHELLVFPLNGSQQPGARAVGADDHISEDGAVGEVQPVCPADTGIDGTPVGGISRIQLKLAAGRYEILCNLPGHYRHGMSALLTVS